MRMTLTPWLLAAALLAPCAAQADGTRRAPQRSPLPQRAGVSPRLETAPSMEETRLRWEAMRIRALYGEDWDEVIVETVDGDVDLLLGRHGGSWRAHGLGRDALKGPPGRSPLDWYLELSEDPRVRHLEPNPRAVHPACRQMSIDILESGTQLVPDLVTQPALDVSSAEALDAGGIIVAIVDSGVAALAALDGVLLAGIDALHPRGPRVVQDPSDMAENALDAHGHGTAMATLVASVAQGASILPVRVVGDDCEGTAFDVASGIAAAAEAGAHVILVSLSTPIDSPLLRRAVQDAQAAGALVVAAAGNDGRVEFPGALPGVLAVTAVNAQGWPPAFAPLGLAVSLAAPGVDVVAIGPQAALRLTGTSPAAAVVAGVAARVVRVHPTRGPAIWADAVRSATRPAEAVSWTLEGQLGAGVLDFAPLK